jgi:ferredoxin/flavodoxin---NADP+ reductase
MQDDIFDITIIGGGPTGLFGAFYAGLRGVSCRIVDSLPELGGQLTALYPEKYVFDVGGIPKILAKDLAKDMVTQAMQFEPAVVLDEEVNTLEREDDHFVLGGRTGSYRSKTIVIAGGKGAFEPRHLACPGYDDLLGHGVYYAVKDPEAYRDKRVLLVGGGDSALDWALILKDVASRLTMIHRRDGFRAHAASIQQLHDSAEAGEIDLRTFWEVRELHGNGAVDGATIFDNRTQEDERLDVDAVLCFLGFKPDLGPIKSWGLELEKNRLRVTQLMETNIEGIYGAGDIVDYPGKMDLIATGYAEAAIAVNQAVHYIDPEARVSPGHSTNLAIFKDQ